MTRSIIILMLATLQVACGSVPRLFEAKAYTPIDFAEAVNHFVNLGEKNAIAELEKLSSERQKYNSNGISVVERVGWMCRVLFEGKGGQALRAPKFGVLEFLPPPDLMTTNWPQFPITKSGSTYFVLWEGYITIGGDPGLEEPSAYVEYCRQNGVFRKQPVPVPTSSEAIQGLAALKNSEAWKSIKWSYLYQGTKCTLTEKYVWTFIEGQANRTK